MTLEEWAIESQIFPCEIDQHGFYWEGDLSLYLSEECEIEIVAMWSLYLWEECEIEIVAMWAKPRPANLRSRHLTPTTTRAAPQIMIDGTAKKN